jgi:hypothetical protein
MLRSKPALLLSIFLFLLSCRERTLDLNMVPHEPKVVVLANWRAGDYLSVRLLRSLDPFKKEQEDIALPSPLIQVLKDGQQLVAEFTSMGDGLYSSNILLEPSHTYQVLVNHERYPQAASQPMFIPAMDAGKIDVRRTKNVQGPFPADLQDYFEIDISRLQVSAQYCYSITFLVSFNDGSTSSYSWPASDVTALDDKACHAPDKVQQQNNELYYWLISPTCLNSTKEKLKFYIGTSGYSRDTEELTPIFAEKIQVRVGVANVEWLSFAQVNSAQPEGIDLLVLSPKLYRSNIMNGYGMVITLNEAVFDYVY